jgi:hypothetical protein
METEDLISSIASLQRQVDLGKSQLDALSSKDRKSARGKRLQDTIDDCEGNMRLLLRELTKRSTSGDLAAAQALTSDGRVVVPTARASTSGEVPLGLAEVFTSPPTTTKPALDRDGLADALGTLDEMEAALVAAAAAQTADATTSTSPAVSAPPRAAPQPPSSATTTSPKPGPSSAQVLSALQHVLKRNEFSMKQLFSACEALGINADNCDSKDMLVDVLWEFARVSCK